MFPLEFDNIERSEKKNSKKFLINNHYEFQTKILGKMYLFHSKTYNYFSIKI